MLFDNLGYKENKRLRAANKELEDRLEALKGSELLVEVFNTYLKERNLYDDFEKFCQNYVGNVFQPTNKLLKIWDNFDKKKKE